MPVQISEPRICFNQSGTQVFGLSHVDFFADLYGDKGSSDFAAGLNRGEGRELAARIGFDVNAAQEKFPIPNFTYFHLDYKLMFTCNFVKLFFKQSG